MQSHSPVEFIRASEDDDLELGLRPTPAYGHVTTGSKTCVYVLLSLITMKSFRFFLLLFIIKMQDITFNFSKTSGGDTQDPCSVLGHKIWPSMPKVWVPWFMLRNIVWRWTTFWTVPSSITFTLEGCWGKIDSSD